MNEVSRRGFLAGAGAVAGAGLLGASAEATPPANSQAAAQPAVGEPGALKYRLGIVTYNIAATWDLPTLLRICRAVGLAAHDAPPRRRAELEPAGAQGCAPALRRCGA